MPSRIEWGVIVLLIVLSVLVGFETGAIPYFVNVCDNSAGDHKGNCVIYGILPYAIESVLGYIDSHNGLVSAATTIIIAIFTIRLYTATAGMDESTRKLWEASRDQSDATERAINESARAASAMEGVAQNLNTSVELSRETTTLFSNNARTKD